MDDLIPTSEVCDLLKVDRATISRWVNHRDPKITPAVKLPGTNGAYLFRRSDVEALLSEHQAAS
jgi:excisionase family DNA binding protein